MSAKRALAWVSFWISLAAVAAYLFFKFSTTERGLEFVTCYAIEWSLSVDNLFVFLMIFDAFGVDPHRQKRALTWGIIGAMILRLVFIYLGLTLVGFFEPVLYVFGAFLIFSAYQMAFQKESQKDITNNRMIKFVRKRFPVTEDFVEDKFFTRSHGKLMATPMLLVLIAIESSDVMFAVDSIPAAFAITRDPLIIFSANIFAILGLRSLYFALAHADRAFRFLKYGVSIILAFVGLKMLAAHFVKPNPIISLAFIMFCLGGSVIASLVIKKRVKEQAV